MLPWLFYAARAASLPAECSVYLTLVESDYNLAVDDDNRYATLVGDCYHLIPCHFVHRHIVLRNGQVFFGKKLFRMVAVRSGWQ